MGIQGIAFDVPKTRLTRAIKEHKGVITHIAKELGYNQETILKHIRKDPELLEELQGARSSWEEEVLDLAENYLVNSMQQFDDRSSGLSAARFYLNNKGRKRGYTPPSVNPDQGKQEAAVVETILDGFRQLHASTPQAQSKDHGESQTS